MMCWVALDRALRLCDAGHIPSRHASTWRREAARDPRVHRDALLVRSDWAATPATPAARSSTPACSWAILLGYESPDPGRLAATVDALRRELGHGPLLSRYSGEDGLRGAEGAFLCCSFWLADALARIGRLDEATELMEQLIALANDVGLYAEELDPHTSELLGNIPQGLVHLALINAAVSIAKASGR